MSGAEYRKLQQVGAGNSFAVTLPKHFATEMGLGKGDFVRIILADSRIIIEPVESREEVAQSA